MRPTGLIDPEVEIRQTKGQIDDLLAEVTERAERGERTLVTTLTKKMAEDLTDYLLEMGVRVRYLHSEVDTLERIELIRDLRLGAFDVLVGINLLREGLDIPEVSLMAILDADKEGFLRSDTSLVQMIGRAARNAAGRVIMYADTVTDSMERAISETNSSARDPGGLQRGPRHHPPRSEAGDRHPGRPSRQLRGSDARRRSSARVVPVNRWCARSSAMWRPADLGKLIDTLEMEMNEASADLRFEYAARLRDEIKELRREIREAGLA